MILKTFQTAAEFLRETQPALEANEAANSLMYGLALRLQRYPERIEIPPYFAVVSGESELEAAALMTPPHNLMVLSARHRKARRRPSTWWRAACARKVGPCPACWVPTSPRWPLRAPGRPCLLKRTVWPPTNASYELRQ